jgi:hypothetical protein
MKHPGSQSLAINYLTLLNSHRLCERRDNAPCGRFIFFYEQSPAADHNSSDACSVPLLDKTTKHTAVPKPNAKSSIYTGIEPIPCHTPICCPDAEAITIGNPGEGALRNPSACHQDQSDQNSLNPGYH